MAFSDVLSNIVMAAWEVLVQGVVVGILLVLAVHILLRLGGVLNGSTRSLIWLATLLALPLIPILCWINQVTPPNPSTPVAVSTAISAAAPVRMPVVATPVSLATSSPVASSPAAPSIRPFDLTVAYDAPLAALGVYFGIAGLLLLRLLASYLRIRLLRRRAQPVPEAVQARLGHWLDRCPTDRVVELALTDKLKSPVAIGFLRPMILMPNALLLELTEEELDDLWVHELAHIRRYDDWANLLLQVLKALLFFHPAIYWVGRKLKFEMEVACDDWVVSERGPKSYARCLAKVVELRRWQRVALLSNGAFFSKAQMLKRLELLLDKTRNDSTGPSAFTAIAIVLLTAGMALQVARLPAFVSFSRDNGDSQMNAEWKDGSRDLRVKVRGEIAFSPDESSIASISPWGYAEIEESRGWSSRRLEVRRSASGEPEQKYFVDGHERPLDQSGRDWAAATYPFVIREAGWDVNGRLERILTKRGVPGVLEEVDLIHSGNTKCKYIARLLDQANLNEDDLRRVASSIRRIPSDHDKAELLIASARHFVSDAAHREYFRAVDSVRSDYEHRRILVSVLETDGRSAGTAELVARSAASIRSDNDKAEVLLTIPASTDASSTKDRCDLLRAAATIRSDFDKARVLKEASNTEAARCRDAFFDVVNQIHSDNDRSGVLRTLLDRRGLEPTVYERVAAAALHMASDNEKANVLVRLAEFYTEPPFFDAVNSIRSDNDRKRVLMKVIESAPPKDALLGAIEAASRMSSDNDKAQILVAAAKLSTDSGVRSALQQACAKMHSDNDYRRVASALLTQDSQ